VNNPISAPRMWALTLTACAAVCLLLVFGTTQPARSQSAVLAAPTATPIAPPSQPLLLSPDDGVTVTGATDKPLGVPTFIWSVSPNAVVSHIQVSDTPGFSELLVDADTEATSFTPTGMSGKDIHWVDGTYYWRVRAAAGPSNKRAWSEYSPIYTFTKDWSDGGSIRPVLLQPPVDAVRSSFLPSDFSWMPVAGAGGYMFEIATDTQFGNNVYRSETLAPQHTPGVRLVGGSYYWRVTPFVYAASAGNRVYGAPSQTGTFRIDWSAPPQQLTPEDGIATPFVPRFQWQAVEGAKSYQLQVSTDSGFNPDDRTFHKYNTANTDFTPNTNLSNDKDYFWRVKAIDQNNNETNWSTVRSFRTQWNFAPKLLTPRNNQIQLSYPYFSWEPVPGAEQYQIQIDDTNQFEGSLIEDTTIYNVTDYTQADWSDVPIGQDAYWHVRAIDASGNKTPWSETWAFRTDYTVGSNLIYPIYTYVPDANLPVHHSPTIAWPVFVWDTAHTWISAGGTITLSVGPDYYLLTVDDDPGFGSPNFSIPTRTLGAAPVFDAQHPERAFSGLVDGGLYYWRVQPIRNNTIMGVPAIWEMRYSRATSELSTSTQSTPIFPRDAYHAVASPPMLGWLPVVIDGVDAYNYHVQISRTSDFSLIVDEAYPQFVNYAPWQGKETDNALSEMPPGTYWWRVRAETSPNVELTPWSEPRRFDLAASLLTGNDYDFKPAPFRPAKADPNLRNTLLSPNAQYMPALTRVASSAGLSGDAYQLDALHMLIDRTYVITEENTGFQINHNLNWAIAFNVNSAPGNGVRYAVVIDNNHAAAARPCSELSAGEIDAGAPYLPPTLPGLGTLPLYAPEYVLYVDWDGTKPLSESVSYYRWNGIKWNNHCTWAEPMTIKALGGYAWYDERTQAIQVIVPYTALGGADDDFSGSLAVALVSTASGESIHSSIPPQGVLPGTPPNTVDNPIFVSDMVQPLYPFDMPLSNPQTQYDMPPLRWRMPIFGSTDGYQVQVASDERFSNVLETWQSYETRTSTFFALIPAAFQSGRAVGDNESYYWRVRIRHERYESTESKYDYGPWSPPQRFKLDSRTVGNPRLSTGSDVFMTPTFQWDRVEGAASYRLQVDDDSLFGSPLIDIDVDGVSYTPPDTFPRDALSSHVQYYWRVAMRRADKVLGAWTPALPLDKNTVAPVPLSPVSSGGALTVTHEQPTFVWSAVLTPTQSPRLAAPLYRLQVDDASDFKSLEIDIATAATSYTPPKGLSLADGQWYWRVASYEATNAPGPFSPTQTFFKQYLLPTPLEPGSNSATNKTPRFAWQPVPGAAYYVLEVSKDAGFQQPSSYSTTNTTYTPTEGRAAGVYYWRVKMVDHDKKEGPMLPIPFNLGRSLYLPFIHR